MSINGNDVSPEQPPHAVSKLVTFPVFIVGKPVKLEQPDQVSARDVHAAGSTMFGNVPVKPEQFFQALANDVKPEPSVRSGNEVRPGQLFHAFDNDVADEKSDIDQAPARLVQ